MAQNADPKQAAFLALYEPVHKQFARFCRARLTNEQEAKDLISDTVLKAYEHFDQLRHEGAFLHFLFGIAHNILLQRHRRGKFWGLFSEKQALTLPDTGASPDSSAEVRLLYEALQLLPDVQREAVILFEISGFSLLEIQEIQQVSLSAVKSRIARGRERLTELLNAKVKGKKSLAVATNAPATVSGPVLSPLQAHSCLPTQVAP